MIDSKDTNPFASFLSVRMTDVKKLLKDPSIIVQSMDEMKLRKREKGSITNEQRYKSLIGRWFGCKEEKIDLKQSVIEIGSIVSLAQRKDYRFLGTVVFRINGNKWHMWMSGYNPAWPLDVSKTEYCIVVREGKVQGDAKNGGKMILLEDNVQDRINARKVFVFVLDLSNIDVNYFKIYYEILQQINYPQLSLSKSSFSLAQFLLK